MLSQLLRRQLQRMKKASKARRQSSAPIEAPDEPWHCTHSMKAISSLQLIPTQGNPERNMLHWLDSFSFECRSLVGVVGKATTQCPPLWNFWSFASIYQYSFMKFGVAVVEWPIDSFQKEDSTPKSKSTHPPNIRRATSLKCFGVLLGSAVF